MNIAQLNFANRQKVSREVILPHPPAFVIEGKEKNGDVWYFVSEKWITLRKKRENTSFSLFLKSRLLPSSTHEQHSQLSNNQTKNNQDPNNSSPVPSLLYIQKENKSYLQSKLKHILKDHSPYNQLSSCEACKQIDRNDYDCLLIERNRFLDQVRKVQKVGSMENKAAVVDKVMEMNLIEGFGRRGDDRGENKGDQLQTVAGHKPEYGKIPKSTFNPYMPDILGHEGFRYSIHRLQQLRQKHHYMTSNTNRANYRKQLNLPTQFHQFSSATIEDVDNDFHINRQESPQQLAQKLSSVLWTQEFIVYDVEKDSESASQQKITNPHMKQKLSEKCDSIQDYLETHFTRLLNSTLVKQQCNSNDPSCLRVKVKQFRLWYLNNSLRNNHCYTICVSEVKVEFAVGDKSWVGEFWTRVQMSLAENEKNSKTQNRQEKPSHNMMTKTNKNRSISANKTKQRPLTREHKQPIEHLVQTWQTNKEITSKQQQNHNTTQQICACCQSSQQQGLKITAILNDSQEDSESFPATRLIIGRHIKALREKVRDAVAERISMIERELWGSKCKTQERRENEVKKQNQLTVALFMLRESLQRLLSSNNPSNDINKPNTNKPDINKPDINKAIISSKSFSTQSQLSLKLYDEALVCEACYQIFLNMHLKTLSNQHKIRNERSIVSANKINFLTSKVANNHKIAHNYKIANYLKVTNNHANKSSLIAKSNTTLDNDPQIEPKQKRRQITQNNNLISSKNRVKSFTTNNQSFSSGTIPAEDLPNKLKSITRPSSHYQSVANGNRKPTLERERTQGDSEWSKTDFSEFEQHKTHEHGQRQSTRMEQKLGNLPHAAHYIKPPKPHSKHPPIHQPTSSNYIIVQNLPQAEKEVKQTKKSRLQKFEEKLSRREQQNNYD